MPGTSALHTVAQQMKREEQTATLSKGENYFRYILHIHDSFHRKAIYIVHTKCNNFIVYCAK